MSVAVARTAAYRYLRVLPISELVHVAMTVWKYTTHLWATTEDVLVHVATSFLPMLLSTEEVLVHVARSVLPTRLMSVEVLVHVAMTVRAKELWVTREDVLVHVATTVLKNSVPPAAI